MKSRTWLATIGVAGVMLLGCAQSTCARAWIGAPSDAPSVISDTIPSTAGGTYAGAGWSCTIATYAVDRNTSIPLPPGGAATFEYTCTAPDATRYFGAISSADGLNCPRRGWYGPLLSFVAPYGSRGELTIVGFDAVPPGTLLLEARVGTTAVPTPLTLTRLTAAASPRPYSCAPLTAEIRKR